MHGKSGLCDGAFQRLHKKRAHRGCGLVQNNFVLYSDITPGRDGSRGFEQGAHRVMPNGIGGVTNIETGPHSAGNDISGAGSDGQRARSSHEAFIRCSDLLRGHDPFSGGDKRVAAQIHGRGAGVIGLALKRQRQAALTHDCIDHAERQVCLIEYGTLLDVKLQVANRPGGEFRFA
jgi:hypothetical protein